MKRIYSILFALLMVLVANAETKTIEQDFSGCNWSSLSAIPEGSLPDGWFMVEQGSSQAYSSGGVMYAGASVYSSGTAYITQAKAGKVEFSWIKTVTFGSASLGVYKAVNNNGTFTLTDELASVSELPDLGSGGAQTTGTFNFNLEEDCYIGIKPKGSAFSNYKNTYEDSGSAVVEKYSVSGTVVYDDTPVAGATVSLAGQSVTTDDSGAFSFVDVDEGDYTITVTADGYKPAPKFISLTADMTDVTISLSPIESYLPVATKFRNENGTTTFITTSTIALYDGETLVSQIEMGGSYNKTLTIYGKLKDQYTLKATAPGYAPVEVTITKDELVEGGTPSLDPYGYYIIYMDYAVCKYTVTVTDKDGNPIEGAEVTVRMSNGTSESGTTQADGTYVYTIQENQLSTRETLQVHVKADGYIDDYYDINAADLIAGTDVAYTFKLTKVTTLSGNVLDETTSAAVKGATVTLYSAEDAEIDNTTTDDMGAYTFTLGGTPAETYKVGVTDAQYYEDAEPAEVTITAGIDNKHNIRLKLASLTFTATVKDSKGEAIEGATVTVTRGENGTPVTAEVQPDGSYVYKIMENELEDGETFTAVANATGYFAETATFDFSEGNATHAFVLKKQTTIAVSVVDDSNSAAVAGATVTLTGADDATVETKTTGEDGKATFELGENPAATYKVSVSADNYVTAEPTEVSVTVEEDNVKEIRLKQTQLTFTATVKDNDGELITDATVTATAADEEPIALTNNNDGTYTFAVGAIDAADKTYTVKAVKDDAEATYTLSFNGTDAAYTFELFIPKGEVTEIVQDFEDCTWSNETEITSETMPEGWFVSGSKGFGFTQFNNFYNSRCVGAANGTTYFITQAYKGKVEFDIIGTYYGNNPAAAAVKMTRNEDGTFTEAEVIREGLESMIKEKYVPYRVEFPLDEDCWLAIKLNAIAFDNYKNTYEVTTTATTYTVSGNVKSDNGAVEGATVTLSGKTTFTATTDAQGAYSIKEVPAGEYSISVSAAGFKTGTGMVTVTDADVTADDITLAPVESKLRVALKAESGIKMIWFENEGTVTLYDGETVVAKADVENYYATLTVYGTPKSTYTLEGSVPGYITKTVTLTDVLKEGETVDQTLILEVDPAGGIASANADGAAIRCIDGKLYISGNATIHDMSGRLIKKMSTDSATVVNLNAGCYIVNGKKVVVK